MAATLVQSATGNELNNTTCTATLGSAATAGNTLVALMTSNRGSSNIVVPTGWTELYRGSNGGGTNLVAAWTTAAGGETSVSFTASIGSSRMLITALEVSGADTTTITSNTGVSSGAVNTLTTPAINEAGVFVAALGLGTGADDPIGWTGWNNSFTEASAHNSHAGSNNVGQSVATRYINPAALTDASQSWSGTAVTAVAGILVLPDADGGGGGGLGEGSVTASYDLAGSATGDAPATGAANDPPVFIGTSMAEVTAANTITVGAPTGLQAGDQQIICVGLNSSDETLTGAPSGWSLIAALTNPRNSGAAGSDFRTEFYASTTDLGDVTFNKNGSVTSMFVVRAAYRGQADIGVAQIQNQSGPSGFTVHPIPAVSTTTNNSLVLAMLHSESPADRVFTPPTGFTERFQEVHTLEDLHIVLAEIEEVEAGTVSGDFTSSGGAYTTTFAVVLDAPSVADPTGSVAGLYEFNAGTVTGEQPAGNGSATSTLDFSSTPTGEHVPKGQVSPKVYAFDAQAAGKRVPKGSRISTLDFSGTGTGDAPGENTSTGSYAFTGSASGAIDVDGTASGSVAWAGSSAGTSSDKVGSASGAVAWSFGGATGDIEHYGPVLSTYAYQTVTFGLTPSGGTVTGAIAFDGEATGEETDILPSEGTVARQITWNRGTTSGARDSSGSATDGTYLHALFTAVGKGDTIIYRFEPPTYKREVVAPPLAEKRPRYQLTESVSVVRVNGTLVEVKNPTSEQLEEAGEEGVDWFLGGHVYGVLLPVSDELTAAGFTTVRV